MSKGRTFATLNNKKLIAACTCMTSTKYIEGNFHATEADTDDLCINCGHNVFYIAAKKCWDDSIDLHRPDDEYTLNGSKLGDE